MKELCEYSKQKKLARKAQHVELIKIYGVDRDWETFEVKPVFLTILV